MNLLRDFAVINHELPLVPSFPVTEGLGLKNRRKRVSINNKMIPDETVRA